MSTDACHEVRVVCCSVLQCAAVGRSELQCVAVTIWMSRYVVFMSRSLYAYAHCFARMWTSPNLVFMAISIAKELT